MDLKPFQEKIIEQMIIQETMLSELYEYFSKQFPKYKKFWLEISSEEERHAKLLQKLLNAAQKGHIVFSEGKIKTYTLDAFIKRLDDLLKKAKNNEFTLKSALINYEGTFIAGTLPSFTWVDAQVSYRMPKTKSVIKIGGSNIGNTYRRTGFGSPYVGGLYYMSYGYNL